MEAASILSERDRKSAIDLRVAVGIVEMKEGLSILKYMYRIESRLIVSQHITK